ncbi:MULTISPECIES: hypothetical protein [Brachybacterium]|uniref:Major facilitator superfamily (MFS) profile domain-containing protein n=1 Tax=Brachybacterium kimchii TaxID=2942909 RepID=A0ABY4NB02_9MICO|nr:MULTISPECIES: hypothetical protein [Brachybacterium]MCG7308022.1 hypothetical protein [Brachybacterium sp. ACRRE]UQN30608.1 hypothetical protein M4486_04675 [Brachybacterium kimchii]
MTVRAANGEPEHERSARPTAARSRKIDDVHDSDRRGLLPPLVIASAQLMVVLDDSIVNIALPSIQHELDVAPTLLPRVVNAYFSRDCRAIGGSSEVSVSAPVVRGSWA